MRELNFITLDADENEKSKKDKFEFDINIIQDNDTFNFVTTNKKDADLIMALALKNQAGFTKLDLMLKPINTQEHIDITSLGDKGVI